MAGSPHGMFYYGDVDSKYKAVSYREDLNFRPAVCGFCKGSSSVSDFFGKRQQIPQLVLSNRLSLPEDGISNNSNENNKTQVSKQRAGRQTPNVTINRKLIHSSFCVQPTGI